MKKLIVLKLNFELFRLKNALKKNKNINISKDYNLLIVLPYV